MLCYVMKQAVNGMAIAVILYRLNARENIGPKNLKWNKVKVNWKKKKENILSVEVEIFEEISTFKEHNKRKENERKWEKSEMK